MTGPVDGTPPLRGDEAEFFAQHADKLRKSVGRAVNTSEDNVDDACAYAWLQFFKHQPRRETAYKWLWKVAWREAIRYDRRSRSLDDPTEATVLLRDPRDQIEAKEAMLDARHQLAGLGDWARTGILLRAAGYTYEEAAERLGISKTRLNQLLTRASTQLREQENEVRLQSPEAHPRAKLLAELVRNPPAFLHAALGRPPELSDKKGTGDRRLAWSRLALAIVDYRLQHGIADPARPFGREQPDRADATRNELQRRIDGYEASQPWRRGRSLER